MIKNFSFLLSVKIWFPARNAKHSFGRRGVDCFSPPRGIEPLSQVPETCVLSVERRGQPTNFQLSILNFQSMPK